MSAPLPIPSPWLPAVATGWVTALDLDLSALGNQSIPTDGVHAVGGLNWTKVNSAADSVAMAIVNGAGLRVTPTQAPDYYANVRTSPLLRLPLTSILADINLLTPIRFWVYIPTCNATDAYDYGFGCIERDAAAFAAFCGGKFYTGSGVHVTFAGLGKGYFGVATPPYNTHNVWLIEMPMGIAGTHATIMSGVYAAGFPAVSAMLPLGCEWPFTDVYNNTALGAIADWGVALSAKRAGSATALVTDFARIRFDYHS